MRYTATDTLHEQPVANHRPRIIKPTLHKRYQLCRFSNPALAMSPRAKQQVLGLVSLPVSI